MAKNPSRKRTPAKKQSLQSRDPKTLENFAWARLDGGRGNGPPRRVCCAAADDDGDEPDYDRLAALRDWFRIALNGDEDSLLLLLQLTGASSLRKLTASMPTTGAGTLCRWAQAYRREIYFARIAEIALERLVQDDGFTIDVRTGEPVSLNAGFFVSIRAGNARFNDPRLADFQKYLRKHRKKLLADTLPRVYFGGWLNLAEDCYEFDLTRWLPDLAAAKAQAIQERQRSMWDCRQRQAIDLDDQDGRQAA